MNHSFNTDIAEEAGIIPAILLENFSYWIRKNRSENSNFFDGDYWTFASVKGLSDLFPYLTKDQIRRAIEKLEAEGFLKAGNYNEYACNRTKWYALTPKAWGFYDNSNCRGSQNHLADMPNENGVDATSLSNITKDITKDIKPINPDGLIVTSVTADDLRPPHSDEKHPVKPDHKACCPHQEIIALYHEMLPMCPQVRDWTPARATLLRARWNEDKKRQNLGYWKRFFEYVATCDFLVGKSGNRPFLADLPWILKAENFAKIREGRYENREAA